MVWECSQEFGLLNLIYFFINFNFFLTNSAVLMPTDGLGMFARIWVIKSDLFFYQLFFGTQGNRTY
jgi:hypothetical protein